MRIREFAVHGLSDETLWMRNVRLELYASDDDGQVWKKISPQHGIPRPGLGKGLSEDSTVRNGLANYSTRFCRSRDFADPSEKSMA